MNTNVLFLLTFAVALAATTANKHGFRALKFRDPFEHLAKRLRHLGLYTDPDDSKSNTDKDEKDKEFILVTTTAKSTDLPKPQKQQSPDDLDKGNEHAHQGSFSQLHPVVYLVIAISGIVILAILGGVCIAFVGRSRLRRVLWRTQSVREDMNEGLKYDRFH